MPCLTAYSLIAGVSETVRQCNPEGNDVYECGGHDFIMTWGEAGEIESIAGQNRLCSCFDELCNKSPWLEKPTMRRPTTRKPAVATDLITEDDSRFTTESLHEISVMERIMSTQSMDHTLPAGYNDHSTDKIQSNGVKALNDDTVFVTLLTLSIIFSGKA